MKKQQVKAAAAEVSGDPLAEYAGMIDRVQAVLDAQCKEAGKPLLRKEETVNKVFQSLNLYLRGNGIVLTPDVTKEERETWKKSHKDFQVTVKRALGIMATKDGNPMDITRLGARKAAGKGADGAPTHWRQTFTGEWQMTREERVAACRSESERWARVASVIQAG